MPTPFPLPRSADARWTFLLCVALPLALAIFVGGDSNWDLRNYHLYGPHALLHGRAGDIAAAQLQGWHNPLLDVPMYLLATSGAPAVFMRAWLATPAMLAMFCLLRLQRAASPTPPSRLAQAVLVLLGLFGAAAWSTFASSMNEGFVAAAMLAALTVVHGSAAPALPRRWLLAGLLAGAMAGLKLSAGFYCLVLAATAWVGVGAREALSRSAWLLLGGVAGIAVTYGPWGWHLYDATGNPFFPYFNQWFQSPDAAFQGYSDDRFRPHGWREWLLTPWTLARMSNSFSDTSHSFSELKLRDPRLLFGLLSLLWLAWRPDPPRVRAATRALALFLLLGTVLWLAQSAIYRYAIGLELVGALGMVLAVQRATRAPRAALQVLLVLATLATRRPDWGRDAGPQSIATMRAPELGAAALVLTATGDPLGYLAIGLPADVPLIGTENNFMHPGLCHGMQRRASARISAQRGPTWLLEDPREVKANADGRALLLANYGLAPAGACQPYANPLAPAEVCPLRRVVAPVAPCLAQPR